jgi:hypothetical protein
VDRQTAAACDRCDDAEAVVTVVCWYGCEHRQCEDCAAATRQEVDQARSPYQPTAT